MPQICPLGKSTSFNFSKEQKRFQRSILLLPWYRFTSTAISFIEEEFFLFQLMPHSYGIPTLHTHLKTKTGTHLVPTYFCDCQVGENTLNSGETELHQQDVKKDDRGYDKFIFGEVNVFHPTLL